MISIKIKHELLAYPPDRIWLKQKSPISFDNKLQSLRTISSPFRSMTYTRQGFMHMLYFLYSKIKSQFLLDTSYGVPSLNCTLTAAYFFFLRSNILLYTPSRSISKHLYFLLTWMNIESDNSVEFIRNNWHKRSTSYSFWQEMCFKSSKFMIATLSVPHNHPLCVCVSRQVRGGTVGTHITHQSSQLSTRCISVQNQVFFGFSLSKSTSKDSIIIFFHTIMIRLY